MHNKAAQLQALIRMLQQDMNQGSASAASQYAAAGAQLVKWYQPIKSGRRTVGSRNRKNW